MDTQHGRHTVVMLDGDDLSQFSDGSQIEINSDSHDVTTYGKRAHVFRGGLLGGTGNITGFYDSAAGVGSPQAIIKPLVGSNVTFIHRPEGTGSGLPQDSVDALVLKYTQTSPVADMVKWAVDLQFSDDVTTTSQS
jgi:hypothetical protein